MAGKPSHSDGGIRQAVADYKGVLASVLDQRPSGTRQRLAAALGKNKSFVSQIANPHYPTPIPAPHLDVIFRVCHFSGEDRDHFLSAYTAAHPKRIGLVSNAPPVMAHTVYLPDLGDAGRNEKLQVLVTDFVRQLVQLVDEQ